MDAEKLLHGINAFLITKDLKTNILPTKGDPKKPQNKVSLIITEKKKKGIIPRFIIHVEDLEAMRKEKNEQE